MKSLSQSEDNVLSQRTTPKRRCAICYETGHHQYLCKPIKTNYGKLPIPKNDPNSRYELAKSLVVTDPISKVLLMVRHYDDKRPVINELQKKI